MAFPALLVVFVLSSDHLSEPTTPSFERAAYEVLGPSTAVRVESLARPLPDAAALARAGAADGVVELTWDADRLAALLHCYISSEERWIERTIQFGARDRGAERGRLLGFAVASMFMDAPTVARAEEAQVHADALQTAPRPSAPAAAPALTLSELAADLPDEPALAGRPGAGRALEFGVVSASGSRKASPELGGAVALRLPLSEPLAVRLQLSARAGEIPDVQVGIRRLLAGLGLAWNVLPDAQSWSLELRGDAFGSGMQIVHFRKNEAEPLRYGWLFGADAVGRLGYRFSAFATGYLGLGFEAMLGPTPIYTHGVEVATERNLRPIGELGLVARF